MGVVGGYVAGWLTKRDERWRAWMPGVVSLPYGWGHHREGSRLAVAREHAGESMNDLCDERLYDHVSGTSVVDGVPVRVESSR